MIRLDFILYRKYDIVKDNVRLNVMSFDRKLMRNGSGWALSINATILAFLDVNPEEDMVKYTMDNDKLIITKSEKKIQKSDKN